MIQLTLMSNIEIQNTNYFEKMYLNKGYKYRYFKDV